LEPTDKDDVLSWQVATVIMLLFSLLALTTMLLGLNPFSIVFNVALVYVPTLVLLGSTVFERNKRPP
jgi:hypothetical protein